MSIAAQGEGCISVLGQVDPSAGFWQRFDRCFGLSDVLREYLLRYWNLREDSPPIGNTPQGKRFDSATLILAQNQFV
jgi:hypothetical protein